MRRNIDALAVVSRLADSAGVITVKKYSNRRLYDTSDSRYVTLDELAEKIRKGSDVRVLDATTEQDLTAATLTQIIIESRGAARLLPVPLLMQLVRLENDALAEFFGGYMTWALEVYLRVKQGAQAVAPYNPFAMAPFSAGNALARMMGGVAPWDSSRAAPPPPPRQATAPQAAASDVADLRRELDELKKSLGKKKRR